jgi:carbon storage regulator
MAGRGHVSRERGYQMLILSRKAGERISIGGEIELTVLDVRKGKVKLGFLGPREVPIHRDEVVRRDRSDQATTIAIEEE